MKKGKLTRFLFLFLLLATCVSCTAKVYVIDRHTVLEDEAAGEWPELDKQVVNGYLEKGPIPFQKTEINTRKKKLYNVLSGEMVGENAESTGNAE
jgi:hypothetical protein